MKLLLTGGAGNVGAYVTRELANHNMRHTVLDKDKPRELPDGVDFVQCDLMNLESTVETIRDFDVVLHLAAIPNAFVAAPEHVMAVNMVTCYNVLEAVRRNGIGRIVYAGSESSSGFGIHDVALKPMYLPIDEEHPLWPHESYSFTKRFGEEMVENYARAFGIEGLSLRYCGVWMENNLSELTAMIAPFLRGEYASEPWFGCYVAAQDVAQAVRLAAQYRFADKKRIPFEAFYITAPTTFYSEPTLDVMCRIFGAAPEVRDPSYFSETPCAPPFDIRKARRMLGYAPRYDCQDIQHWETL